MILAAAESLVGRQSEGCGLECVTTEDLGETFWDRKGSQSWEELDPWRQAGVFKNRWYDHESGQQDTKKWHNETWSVAEDPKEKLISAAKKDDKPVAEETIRKQGAVFAKTTHSRLRQISSRHDENLDRTDNLTTGTGKKGSLESTIQPSRHHEIRLLRNSAASTKRHHSALGSVCAALIRRGESLNVKGVALVETETGIFVAATAACGGQPSTCRTTRITSCSRQARPRSPLPSTTFRR